MSTQLIILGMHRSGTSLTGQVVEALGFHFGPEQLAVPAKEDNPLGYWERKDVCDLCDEAFAALGKSWERIGSWDIQNLPASFLREFDDRARAIIGQFPAGKPWFLKDPRMCVMLPLWEKHFDTPVYLFSYRDPVEICRSLWSRNHYPASLVMASWERYLGDALNATQGKKRLMIRYADLVQDPRGALRSLHAELSALGAEPSCSVEAALGRITIDGKLRHHERKRLELEIPFTESQASLNCHLLSGSAFNLPGPVDVSAANRQMRLYEEIISFGELKEVAERPTPAVSEALSCLLEEAGKGIGNPHDAQVLANRLLKMGRDAFVQKAREVLEAIDPLRTLESHLGRPSPLSTISSDYTWAVLTEFCDELRRNPLKKQHRMAREKLAEYGSDFPEKPSQVIKRSKVKSGNAWAKALKQTGLPLENLMGEIILGRFPKLPPVESQSPEDQRAAIAQYRSGLEEGIALIHAALEPINALLATLSSEGTKKVPLVKETIDAAKSREELDQLWTWSRQLCIGNPFSPARLKAVWEFKKYQASGTFKPLDQERLRGLRSLATTAEKRLSALLADLEQAVRVAGKVSDVGLVRAR